MNYKIPHFDNKVERVREYDSVIAHDYYSTINIEPIVYQTRQVPIVEELFEGLCELIEYDLQKEMFNSIKKYIHVERVNNYIKNFDEYRMTFSFMCDTEKRNYVEQIETLEKQNEELTTAFTKQQNEFIQCQDDYFYLKQEMYDLKISRNVLIFMSLFCAILMGIFI